MSLKCLGDLINTNGGFTQDQLAQDEGLIKACLKYVITKGRKTWLLSAAFGYVFPGFFWYDHELSSFQISNFAAF